MASRSSQLKQSAEPEWANGEGSKVPNRVKGKEARWCLDNSEASRQTHYCRVAMRLLGNDVFASFSA